MGKADIQTAVESSQGYVYCHECRDFVYDPTFEEIRAPNNKKRKNSAALLDADKKLISTHTASTPRIHYIHHTPYQYNQQPHLWSYNRSTYNIVSTSRTQYYALRPTTTGRQRNHNTVMI